MCDNDDSQLFVIPTGQQALDLYLPISTLNDAQILNRSS